MVHLKSGEGSPGNGGRFLMPGASALLLALTCFLQNVSAQGFQSITGLKPVLAAKTTGEKPQSKTWRYDGKWWAVFPVSSGTFIWRLDGVEWTPTVKITSSTSVEADCKVLANVCHIFLWRNGTNASQLISVEYNENSGAYDLWTERSATVLVQLDSGAETGTIDIDKTGRMWLAYDGINDIRVRWSDSPYTTWSSPVIVASGITDDDICAVIALPVQHQVGIFWSDQNAKRFGFKTHDDGAAPTEWSADEMPAAQSALDVGKGMGDDHLNLAIATDGTLYCAIKTSYDTPGYPRLGLLKRSSNGAWDDLYEVSQTGTRGIVLLNEAAGTLKIVYTSNEDGGDILYRESSLSSITFGPALTLIGGAYNNPTSTKDNYESDVVILASDMTTIVSALGSDDNPVTAIDSDTSSGLISALYPNPADDRLTVDLPLSDDDDNPSISIADVSGKIYTGSYTFLPGSIGIDLDHLHLRPGAYFLTIRSGRHSRVFNFIKR